MVLIWVIASASISDAATYYVRTNGGTADQCTGLADVPYQGSGTNQACAWSHPFWALNGDGEWKIQGGDILVIGSGSYRMGINAANTDWCAAEGSYDCHLPPLPSARNRGTPYLFILFWLSSRLLWFQRQVQHHLKLFKKPRDAKRTSGTFMLLHGIDFILRYGCP